MEQYHLCTHKRHKEYIIIRTPDYKSCGWFPEIKKDMFIHDYTNKPGHFSKDMYKNKPIEEMVKKNTQMQVIASFTNCDYNWFIDTYPELMI